MAEETQKPAASEEVVAVVEEPQPEPAAAPEPEPAAKEEEAVVAEAKVAEEAAKIEGVVVVETPSFSLKAGLAQILYDGAIFEVNSSTQAKIVEDANATCLLLSDFGPIEALRQMLNANFVREVKRIVSISVMEQI